MLAARFSCSQLVTMALLPDFLLPLLLPLLLALVPVLPLFGLGLAVGSGLVLLVRALLLPGAGRLGLVKVAVLLGALAPVQGVAVHGQLQLGFTASSRQLTGLTAHSGEQDCQRCVSRWGLRSHVPGTWVRVSRAAIATQKRLLSAHLSWTSWEPYQCVHQLLLLLLSQQRPVACACCCRESG